MHSGKHTLFVLMFLIAALHSSPLAETILITGTVMDQSGKGMEKALVRLVFAGVQTETDSSGNFTLSSTTQVIPQKGMQRELGPMLLGGTLHFSVPSDNEDVKIDVYDLTGAKVCSIAKQQCQQGTYMVNPLAGKPGAKVYVINVQIGSCSTVLKFTSFGKNTGHPVITRVHSLETSFLAKRSTLPDTLIVTKAGYKTIKEIMYSYTGQHSFFLDVETPGQKFANFARSGLTDLSFLAGQVSLEWLNLDSNEFSDLTPLSTLTNLTYLNIRNCFYVSNVTALSALTKLTYLNLEGCRKITDITPLQNLTNLENLFLTSANGVTDIRPLSKLTNLKKLDLGWANGIAEYSACSTLTGLEWIRLAGAKATNISGISGLPNLATVLIAHNALSSIGLANLPKVTLIDFEYCDSVREVILSNMPSLDTIDLSRCVGLVRLSLTGLPGLQYLKFGSGDLTTINLSGLDSISTIETSLEKITNLTFVNGLGTLKTLSVTDQDLTDLSAISGLTNLTSLTLRGDGLVNIAPVAGLTALKNLSFSYCGSISDISGLSSLTGLENLDLSNCRALASITVVSGMTKLKSLNLRYCQGLNPSLPPMSQLTSLRNLNFNNCSTLTNVSSLNGLTGINYIDMRYCGLDSSSAGPIMNVLGLGDTLKYSTGQLSAAQVSQLTAKGVVMPLY